MFRPFSPFKPFQPFTGLVKGGSAAILESIAVTPAAQTIDDGGTLQFTATGTYDDASTADITATVTWESDDTGVATIDEEGLATGTGPGQATISATLGAVSGDTTLDVSAVPLWSRDLTTLSIGADGTFGRASTAYAQDYLGVQRLALADVARFGGARMAYNHGRYCNDLTQKVASGTTALWLDFSNGLSSTDAETLAATVANGVFYQNHFFAHYPGIVSAAYLGDRITLSCEAKHGDGNFVGTFRFYNLNTNPFISQVIVLTNNWVRYSVSWVVTSGTGNARFGWTVPTVTTPGTIKVRNWMVQINGGEVPATWLDNPKTTLTAGTAQFFGTTNGNTVDANGVVTEAAGAALPGPFGLLMEPLQTSLILYSNDFTNAAWATAQATKAAGPTTPRGLTSMGLNPNTAEFSHRVTQASVPVTSGQSYTFEWLVKDNGYNAVGLLIPLDGNQFCAFNLTDNSVIGAGASITDATIVDDLDGWKYIRATITATSTTTVTLGTYVGADTNFTAGTGAPINYLGDTGLGIYLSAPKFAITADPSSFILTTTAPAALAVDTLSYSGVPADNETRITKRLVSAPGTEVIVDIDDWGGTVPAPTVPQSLQRIDVYAPGQRPVL